MKRFFEKAKNSVQVGFATAMDAVDAKKIDDDPEFVELNKEIQLIEKRNTNLISLVKTASETLQKASNAYHLVTSTFSEIFQSDPALSESASSNSQKSKKINTDITNFCSYYSYVNVVKKLEEFEDEINALKPIAEKRKHNLILKKNAEESDQKKSTEESRAQLAARKLKYEGYHDDYVTKANAIKSKCNERFTEAYQVFQFYLIDIFDDSKLNYADQLKNIPIQELSAKYDSITVAPPHPSS
uniref:BAR domain-containing protein n=1 Tax=Coptotermes formosanus TaxID=36987 RepID=R4UL78_COPFO|nr:hypothetical protein [Coptotermes formosanus]